MASEMYITESQRNDLTVCPAKFASTNSIPALLEESSILGRTGSIGLIPRILREPKARRHSVLDDLRTRGDSFFQRARRGSISKETEINGGPEVDKSSKGKKEKRCSSDGNRRGSIFYVSDDLLEENQEVLALETSQRKEIEMNAKKGRRKSWHPLANKPPKMDRKRRKGVAGGPGEAGSTEGLYNARQKRLSWWNIFVPDSVGRSRRMSQQDVTHTRSTENLIASYFRSKSLSVDHGFTTPYDLASLRSKVQSCFESMDKLSKDTDESTNESQMDRVLHSTRASLVPTTHRRLVRSTTQ